jgi:hypothetical protein
MPDSVKEAPAGGTKARLSAVTGSVEDQSDPGCKLRRIYDIYKSTNPGRITDANRHAKDLLRKVYGSLEQYGSSGEHYPAGKKLVKTGTNELSMY